MKQSWLLIFLITACSNPIPPTGGPKDLDPPILINTVPENKTLNFTGSEISMEFDEYIKEENILTQLMITPNLKDVYSYKINRNTFILTFESPLDSATTYTLNFREGLKDITEGNVPPNLTFVFSTGTFLDSASIRGVVRSLMTNKILEDITISLYNDPDTITIFNGPPRYSTLSDKEGHYTIENIKNGNYTLYALNDENSNLKLESRSEGYGYIKNPLVLNDSMPSQDLFIYKLDTRPIVLQNSRPSGKNFDLKFNKPLARYHLLTDDQSIISNLIDDNKSLRIYFNETITDSLGLKFIVEDSLLQTLDSLVYIKFEKSTKKPDKFNFKFRLNNGAVDKLWSTSIKFNKPIAYINYDSIYFKFDSLLHLPVNDSLVTFNSNKDEILISIDFDQVFKNDSILSKWKEPFNFNISKGSIISVENDTLSAIDKDYTFKNPKDFATIRGNITTASTSYFIQLVNPKFKIVEEIKINSSTESTFEFIHIAPGSYSIRVLVDENNNGIWDPGNILIKEMPEKVFIFFHANVNSQEIKLRANWEQTGLDITF